MPREDEPTRPPAPAPRGCLLALGLVVVLALVLLVLLSAAGEPRFPGADPF